MPPRPESLGAPQGPVLAVERAASPPPADRSAATPGGTSVCQSVVGRLSSGFSGMGLRAHFEAETARQPMTQPGSWLLPHQSRQTRKKEPSISPPLRTRGKRRAGPPGAQPATRCQRRARKSTTPFRGRKTERTRADRRCWPTARRSRAASRGTAAGRLVITLRTRPSLAGPFAREGLLGRPWSIRLAEAPPPLSFVCAPPGNVRLPFRPPPCRPGRSKRRCHPRLSPPAKRIGGSSGPLGTPRHDWKTTE
jgi:hypothetical protein